MEISNRMYSKTELGLLFFPEATSKATARRHLMDWIKRCIPLWDELKKQGYLVGCQYFSPRQVAVIFEYLGGSRTKADSPRQIIECQIKIKGALYKISL